MIREACEKDIPRIIEMGSRSLLEGPYRDEIADKPEHTKRLAALLINNPHAKILVYENDQHLFGVLAFILFPHYFSGELTAGELIWYVEPEARAMKAFGDGPAINLLREAETLARKLGAIKMQFTAPTTAVGELYKRVGYKQVEVSYQRTL
jgi:hypothetical protein